MTKYVLANVEIPIEVKDDGSIESLHSYAQIHIIKEIKSPEEIEQSLPSVHEQIDALFSSSSTNEEKKELPTEEIILLKKDIKNERRQLVNTSFKNKKPYKYNKTMKSRSI